MASIVEKKPGAFMMRWTVNDPVTGKLSKRSRMFAGKGGRRAAAAEANRLEAAERDAPTAAAAKVLSLRKFIMDRWLPHIRATTSATTARTHEQRINKVLAHLGDTPIGQVTGAAIDTMTANMADAGVSDFMRRHYYDTLRTALRQGRKWKIVSGEPWMDATRPKATRKRVKVATLDDSYALADAFRAADRPVAAAYIETIADTGARPGEVLALRWDAVDLDAGNVQIWRALERISSGKYRIKNTPKNDGSIRTVALGKRTIETLRALRAHHAELHLSSGGIWPKDGLLFPNTTGEIWGVHSAAQVIKRMADKHGLATGSYSRRHGMASEMLAGQVPVAVVADRLGHASTKMTLDVYTHALPQHRDAAVDWLNKRG
jgi:integrase